LIIFLFFSVGLIIGLIKPSALVKKGETAPPRKKILSLIIPMLIFFILFAVTKDDSSKEATQQLVKPEIQYTINKKEVPKTDPSAWSPGSKRQISYVIQVPEETSQEQVKKIAEYIIETEAKPLKNWNVAWFVFATHEKPDSGFATGVYTKNAKVPDGNQVKPGEYKDFIWGWNFYN
jgi:hypothetical protein